MTGDPNTPATDKSAPAIAKTALAVCLLVAAGAGGFVAYRLSAPRGASTLTPVQYPGTVRSRPEAGESDESAPPTTKKIPEVLPDVAMPGDPNTGLRIGETQAFPDGTYYATFRLGGTSLSSPLFAGVVADAIQYNNGPIGFINPLLYRNVDTSAITDVLPLPTRESTVRTNFTNDLNKHDGYTTLLQTIGASTAIFTGKGYDDMTGVGTPNGVYFLQAMKY